MLSSRLVLMSHRPTTSPRRPASSVSLSPLPPTPMQAKRTRSFGEGRSDRAKAGAPPSKNEPVPAATVCFKKSRRSILGNSGEWGGSLRGFWIFDRGFWIEWASESRRSSDRKPGGHPLHNPRSPIQNQGGSFDTSG